MLARPADEDRMMDVALECGADDVNEEGDLWEITGTPDVFSDIRDGLKVRAVATTVFRPTNEPRSEVGSRYLLPMTV